MQGELTLDRSLPVTIKIDLKPEAEAKLAVEARLHGLALEEYVQQLLQEAVDSTRKERSRASQEDFRGFLDALATKAPNVPQLRASTFSRGMIYGEHD
jgi:hypothetical protein